MVKIRIWRPGFTDHTKPTPAWGVNIGHASLEVNNIGDHNYAYISVWPAGLALPFSIGPGRPFTLQDDIMNEGKETYYYEEYHNLNENAIIHYWNEHVNHLKYDFIFFNCMSNVAFHLAIGQKGLGVKHEDWCRLIGIGHSHHLALRTYAIRLKYSGY